MLPICGERCSGSRILRSNRRRTRQKTVKGAQFSCFMKLSAGRALSSAHFIRPTARFIRDTVEEQSAKVQKTIKIAEAPFYFSSSLLPRLPGHPLHLKKGQHGKKNLDKSVEKRNVFKHKHLHEIRIYSSLETSSMSPVFLILRCSPKCPSPARVEKEHFAKERHLNRKSSFYRL